MSDKKPAAKRGKSSLLSILLPLLVGGLIGAMSAFVFMPMAGGSDLLYFVYVGVFILGLPLAFITQIIFHEGGHLIFGLMSGYQFLSFNILGLIWTKDERGRLQMKRMKLAGAGGQCLMAPPDYNGGDFPFTLYNLGGVLANVITAGLFALGAWLIPWTIVKLLCGGQILIGLYFAVANGLPIATASIQNDGRNLLCAYRSPHARRAFWVQMMLAADVTRGRRLRDMPEEWFAPFPEEEMDNPLVCSIAVQQTSRLMDQLDFPAALAAINTLLKRDKGVLGLYRMSMTCDGAVCELIAGQPGPITAALSQPEITQLMKAMKDHPTILRTRYAVALLAEKDTEKAEKLLAAFHESAKKHPYPQDIRSENEIILAIQNSLLTRGDTE